MSYVSKDASLGQSASTVTYSSLSLTVYYYLLLLFAICCCCCCCAVDAAGCTADDCAAATPWVHTAYEFQGKGGLVGELIGRKSQVVAIWVLDIVQKPPDRAFLIAHFSAWRSPRVMQIVLS